MTEHFEDFDPQKLESYLQEAQMVSGEVGFVLIPALEVHLAGIDTLVFPGRDYQQIAELASGDFRKGEGLLKLLVHPTKYPLQRVFAHLDRFNIQGIELWNQEVDGHSLPPFRFLKSFLVHPRCDQYLYFFGCDLHNVRGRISNILILSQPCEKSPEAIMNCLRRGYFSTRNLRTGIEFRNGNPRMDLASWLTVQQQKTYYRGRLVGWVRNSLRSAYKQLPRSSQRSLNDVKNYVRNRL